MLTEQILCLATAIFFEARDQPLEGQEFVAMVVMNRVGHEDFPDTVCGVVEEPKSFSFTHDGLSDDMNAYDTHFDAEARVDALTIAQEFIFEGKPITATSTHYHTTGVEPFWSDVFKQDFVFGSHVFYTCEKFC